MSPASLPQSANLSTLPDMSAARASRAQQLRTRLTALNKDLAEAESQERDAILEQAAKVQRDYIEAERARKKFVRDFLAKPASERIVEAREVYEAMGISKQWFYPLGKEG